MSRRPAIRKTDVNAAVAPLLQHGLRPTAIDFLPGGGIRCHFHEINLNASDDLDKELLAFEAKHGGA